MASFAVPDVSHAVSLTFSQLNNRGTEKRKAFSAAQRYNFALSRKWTCAGCGAKDLYLTNAWDIDHRVGLAEGGSNDASNLQLLCSGCHANKTRIEGMVRAASRASSRSEHTQRRPGRRVQELQARHRAVSERMKEAYKSLGELVRECDELGATMARELGSRSNRAESALRLSPETEVEMGEAFSRSFYVQERAGKPIHMSEVLVSLVSKLPLEMRPEVTVHCLPGFLRRRGVVLASDEGPAYNLGRVGGERNAQGKRCFGDIVEGFRASKK